MSGYKSAAVEAAVVAYLLNNTTFPSWLTSLTTVYISLHNADPTPSGNQTSNETTYGGYSRIAVSRSSSGWTCSGGLGTNVNVLSFPACTSGSDTITFFAVGEMSTGAGNIIYAGPLSSGPVYVTPTAVPQFTISGLEIQEI